jgi:hypothetical protein
MALTLAQLAKVETDPLKKYVLTNLLREVKIFEVLPFQGVDSLRSVAVRWQTLPDVAFRTINEGYTPSEGDVEQVWESVYGFGGEIKLDRVFDKIKNTIVDLKKTHTDMKLMAMACKFNDYFINGDHATDHKGFEGLKKRVSNMPSRQSVYFAGSAAAALDPTASVANGNAFFTKLEELHYKTARGEHSAFMMNEGMKWGPGRVARYIGFSGGNILDATQDSFDRTIPTLYGSPMIDVGLKKDQSTEIITGTEIAGDAGADATSIYAMAFNEMQGITGIQLSDMEVYDPLNGGEQESTPTKLVRIDWWCGLAGFGSYGVARGQNVEDPSNWTA